MWNLQKNTRKTNPTMFRKNYIPQPSWIYPRSSKLSHILESTILIHHVNRLKPKHHDYIRRCKKSIWQIWHPFVIKTTSKVRMKWNLLSLLKKPTADIILNGKKIWCFPINIKHKARMLLSLPFNLILKGPANSKSQEKRCTGCTDWKRKNKTMFVHR